MSVFSSGSFLFSDIVTLAKMANRELSMISLVATVRYDVFDETETYWEDRGGRLIKWIRCDSVWRSKRRFQLRVTLADMIAAMRADPTRFSLWQHTDESMWVSAV